jgi:hypothetical protein
VIHTSDFADADTAPVTPILPLSLTAVIAVRLAAQALFPGRSARQSQVGGRHHDRSNAR